MKALPPQPWNATNVSASQCQTFEEAFKDDLMNKTGLLVLFGMLYCFVWLFGVGGNALVVYVAFTRRLAFNVRSVFVIALAISDIFIGMTSLPITAVTVFTREWIFAPFLCYCIGFFQAVGIFVSSFTLCAIAVDRYFLITYPQKNIVTPATASLSLALLLGVGVVLASPMAVHMTLEPYPPMCGVFCDEAWPEASVISRQWYGVAVLILQFGLPCAISALCYWRIGVRLEQQVHRRKQHEVLMPTAERRLIERRRRTTRMMTSMVLGFVIFWLPLNVINSLRDFSKIFSESNELSLIFAVGHLLAMVSLVYNPIIYCWFKEPFRVALKSILLSVRCSCNFCLHKNL